jgi:hypothetical protein
MEPYLTRYLELEILYISSILLSRLGELPLRRVNSRRDRQGQESAGTERPNMPFLQDQSLK